MRGEGNVGKGGGRGPLTSAPRSASALFLSPLHWYTPISEYFLGRALAVSWFGPSPLLFPERYTSG